MFYEPRVRLSRVTAHTLAEPRALQAFTIFERAVVVTTIMALSTLHQDAIIPSKMNNMGLRRSFIEAIHMAQRVDDLSRFVGDLDMATSTILCIARVGVRRRHPMAGVTLQASRLGPGGAFEGLNAQLAAVTIDAASPLRVHAALRVDHREP